MNRKMSDGENAGCLSWEAWAALLGRDPEGLDVGEIITADMAMGSVRRRLVQEHET